MRLFRCFAPHDDMFAEEMAAYYAGWAGPPHPLGAVPLVEIIGTRPRMPPPGLSEAQLRADSMRLDLSKLSSRGRAIRDPLSGHHAERDNSALIVDVVLEMMRSGRVSSVCTTNELAGKAAGRRGTASGAANIVG